MKKLIFLFLSLVSFTASAQLQFWTEGNSARQAYTKFNANDQYLKNLIDADKARLDSLIDVGIGGGGGYDGDPAIIDQDATHRFVTDIQVSGWNAKAEGNHNHDLIYSLIGHNHDALYSALGHVHDLTGDHGDITASGTNGTTWSIDAGSVAYGDIQQVAALSILGRASSSVGNVNNITSNGAGQVLKRTGTLLTFGTLIEENYTDLSITNAKINDVAWGKVTGAPSFALSTHNHDGVYALSAHNHDLTYAGISHTHTGVYEPADAAIQTHINSAHAPANADNNADITKAEIEAKLIGEITSHTHPASGGIDFTGDHGDITASGVNGDTWTIDAGAVTAAEVGLGNVNNTSDANKPISTATQTALDAKQASDADLTTIGGLTPTNGDMIQRVSGAWANRTMAQVKTDLSLTKSDVGLANVDNTSDVNKPVSTAQQTALDGKQPIDTDLTAIAGIAPTNGDMIQRVTGAWVNRTMAQIKTDLALTKSDVGLANVDNTSDANKPVSTAQATAINAKVEDNITDGTTNVAPSENATFDALALKQATLVSGTNIKTINGASVLGSGDLVVTGGSGDVWTKIILAADVSTPASTAITTLTGMTFSYDANSTYLLNFYMLVSAAAASTGHGFGVDCSTAPNLVAFHGTATLANTGTVVSWQANTDNTIEGVTTGHPTINASMPSMGQGILVTGASAGTAQFIFRSEVAAVATAKAKSTITVLKIQ